MARIELTQSGVLFNEELHEYWLDGKQLSGNAAHKKHNRQKL